MRSDSGARRDRPSSFNARDAWALAFFLGALWILRLSWLWHSAASAGYWEESYRWTVAHELLTRPAQPLLEYQADHYQGGSLVMSLLSVPFLALFGESMKTFKLSALLVSSGTLTMIFLLGRRFFGRSVAWLASAAYLAGPPLVAFWGLSVMGSHGESILFSLGQIYLFLGILAGRKQELRAWAALGLVSGLGVWFCYTSALSVAACGLAWLILRGPPRRREFLTTLAGGLLGLAPWFAYNVRHSFQGFVRILQLLGFGNPIDPWAAQGVLSKAAALFTHDLPVGLMNPMDNGYSRAANAVVALAFILPLAVALLAAVLREGRFLMQAGGPFRAAGAENDERRRELVFVVYAFVFLLAFLSSRFAVDPAQGIVAYRFFTPPAVLLAFPAAISAVRAYRRRGGRRLAAVAGCLLALTASALATTALALRFVEDRQFLDVKRGYFTMGALLYQKFESDLARALEAADRLPEAASRDLVWRGIGRGVEYRLEKEETFDRARRELAALPPLARVQILEGAQWEAGVRTADLSRRADPGRYRDLLARISRIYEFARRERARLPAE